MAETRVLVEVMAGTGSEVVRAGNLPINPAGLEGQREGEASPVQLKGRLAATPVLGLKGVGSGRWGSWGSGRGGKRAGDVLCGWVTRALLGEAKGREGRGKEGSC